MKVRCELGPLNEKLQELEADTDVFHYQDPSTLEVYEYRKTNWSNKKDGDDVPVFVWNPSSPTRDANKAQDPR